MSETTHLICAHCGRPNAVSNHTNSSDQSVLKCSIGKLLFDCKHCEAVYPLAQFETRPEIVIDECSEAGHKFAKLSDHPKKDGRPQCPYCLAIGLEASRAAQEAQLKTIVKKADYFKDNEGPEAPRLELAMMRLWSDASDAGEQAKQAVISKARGERSEISSQN